MLLAQKIHNTANEVEDAAVAFDHLLEVVAARRDEFDRLTYVPRDVIGLMKKARLFRSSTPAKFGGDAIAPHLFLEQVERIAEVDGSTAWVAAFGSANSYLAALPVETQAEIYATGPDQVFAGGLYPLAPAVRENGGFRVSGRWRWASGCRGADWIGVGLAIPSNKEGAPPTAHMAVAPAAEVTIIDNWNVLGMQGTGSHDTTVTDKFYAEKWTCGRGAPSQIDEPLFHYPPLCFQAEVHAAVNLGLARAALDLAASMSGGNKIMPGAVRLADRAYFRTGLAQGEAKLRSARLFYYETAAKAWDVVTAGDEVSLELANLLRLSATHASQTSHEVVQTAFRISGMASIEKTHRMQHIVRDSLVITQHAAINDATLEASGAIFAGVPAPAGFPG